MIAETQEPTIVESIEAVRGMFRRSSGQVFIETRTISGIAQPSQFTLPATLPHTPVQLLNALIEGESARIGAFSRRRR